MKWWDKKTHYWPSQKLFINFRLSKTPDQSTYSIESLIYPKVMPPGKFILPKWTGFRALVYLCNAKEYGITLKEININPAFAETIEESDEEDKNGSFFRAIHNKFFKKLPPEAGSQEWLLEAVKNHKSYGLKKDGSGKFVAPKEPLENWIPKMLAAHFCKITLDVDQELLEKKNAAYLDLYKANQLGVKNRRSSLSYEFCTRVIDEYLESILKHHGGSQARVELYSAKLPEGTYHPHGLLNVFAEKYEKELLLWNLGLLHIPFTEHFVTKDSMSIPELGNIDLEITGIEIYLPKPTWTAETFDYEKMAAYFGVKQHVDIGIQAKLTKIDQAQLPIKALEEIKIIEVIKSETARYSLYVNQKYSFKFTKNTKLGKLLYTISKDSQASYISYSRQYKYVQHDKEFQIFANTNFEHIPILARTGKKDHTIVSNPEIIFRLIETPYS